MNRHQRRALKARGFKMSSKRTKEELQNVYNETCAKAGEVQYVIASLELSLKELNKKLLEINKEHQELQEEEASKKAQEDKKE
jgi:hypothetical protein